MNFASKELKAALMAEDPEIRTLAAWLENPVSLKDAPEEMKRNRPICMAALAQDCHTAPPPRADVQSTCSSATRRFMGDQTSEGLVAAAGKRLL